MKDDLTERIEWEFLDWLKFFLGSAIGTGIIAALCVWAHTTLGGG